VNFPGRSDAERRTIERDLLWRTADPMERRALAAEIRALKRGARVYYYGSLFGA